jgi:predicted SprT family Zn-dependent metalloprotease
MKGQEQELPTSGELHDYGEELLALWDATEISGAWRAEWNSRMRTRAGVAYLEALRIELNPRLLARHPEQVSECLAHELAHLVVHRRHGRAASAHGPEWAALMKIAGFAPSRVHHFDTRGLKQERRRYVYLHQCVACGAHWIARKVRRDLVCRDCGPGAVRVLRAPDTQSGLRKLREAAAQRPTR